MPTILSDLPKQIYRLLINDPRKSEISFKKGEVKSLKNCSFKEKAKTPSATNFTSNRWITYLLILTTSIYYKATLLYRINKPKLFVSAFLGTHGTKVKQSAQVQRFIMVLLAVTRGNLCARASCRSTPLRER